MKFWTRLMVLIMGQKCYWTGRVDKYWNNPFNWRPCVVPGKWDTAIIGHGEQNIVRMPEKVIVHSIRMENDSIMEFPESSKMIRYGKFEQGSPDAIRD